MNSVRWRKIQWLVLIAGILGFALALVLFALRQNISLFYTPSDIAKNQPAASSLIRVGGMVKPGSVKRARDSLQVWFTITDFKQDLRVSYDKILPDLFREGQGVVVNGHMLADAKVFIAEEVLAKHDENYMPPELKDISKAQGKKTL